MGQTEEPGRRVGIATRKVFACQPESEKFLRITVIQFFIDWKLSRFPDELESFQVIWKVSRWSEQFPDDLESFQAVWTPPLLHCTTFQAVQMGLLAQKCHSFSLGTHQKRDRERSSPVLKVMHDDLFFASFLGDGKDKKIIMNAAILKQRSTVNVATPNQNAALEK